MADSHEEKSGETFSESVSSAVAQARSAVEGGIIQVQTGAEEGLKVAVGAVLSTGQVVAEVVRQGLDVTEGLAAESKAYVDVGISHLQAAEDVVVGQIKAGLDWVGANPYAAYPLLTAATLVALPGTRRFLYRATLGWLRSPDNIIKSSEGKVDGLRVKMSDYSNEAKKLEERLLAAEEEYTRGRAKLKATRLELQRLASVVSKSERSAAGVLEDLRAIKKVDKAMQLRAEAAGQVSALKAQRIALQQYVYRIANKDI